MKRQRGVALAIVVWFIAGMSLLVAGIVASAKVDTKTTQLYLARAKAVAAGDGAITLAMVERRSGFDAAGGGPMVSESRQRLGDVEVLVRIIPAAGFVDVNNASPEMLQGLFHFAGGMDKGEAQMVAASVIKWRSGLADDTAGKRTRLRKEKGRFYSLEDMLRVDGVTRTLLDSIRDYAVAGSWTSGAMDWSSAPESMMNLLSEVNPGQADAIGRRRASMASAGSVGRLRGGGVYRADALVSYGGRTWLRRRWLKMESVRGSALPWQAVRTEAPRVVGG
ncbi:hypothetical protein [Pseudohalioglobus lutimaris]|uniref:General secretion pathway protein GspK n=1 Tax=Pseudohalioglobus lutimaris TaxID=1737061 RepID=A0A2N5X7F1_9GAMM|nr:hypothetical protein [Pseudohalioglobus lutimaris]PLW70416.1 hypothetical protein C0039_04240 [Pseudohalioglobus lutimaris]